jgi:hypothetical protein
MFYRKCNSENMPQHVICQSDPKQDISGNYEFANDFDLDEEIDSYLNQLEAIPIELCEEGHGDSSDVTKGVKNVLTETPKAVARNTPKHLKSPTKSENTESTGCFSSIIAKTIFSVLQKKRQEEESKLSVARVNSRQTASGSNSEDKLSTVICRQLMSKTKEMVDRVAKVKHSYDNSKKKTPREKSLSAIVSPNRSGSQEKSPEITVLTTYMKRNSISKSNLWSYKKRKSRREREKRVYNKNMSDISTSIVNTGEIMQQSISTTQTQDGIKTDIIPCIEAASSVPLEKYCDSSNDHDDDQNVVPQINIKTENNLIEFKGDFTLSPSSLSSASSLSGRETVILPLRDPRLPHLNQESQLASLKKWAADVMAHVSSESFCQSIDPFCMISKREPSPFPISKPLSEIPTCGQIVSDCSKIYEGKNVATNESDSLLTSKENEQKLLKKSKSKDKDLSTLCYYERKRSHSRSQFPSIRLPFKLGYHKSKSKNLQPVIDVRRKLCDKTPSPSTMRTVIVSKFPLRKQKLLTPSPPRYSRSEYRSRLLHESKIPPRSFSTGQHTEERRTPASSRSDTSAKTEIESSKPKNNIPESRLIHDSKYSAPIHHASTSISHKRRIIDYKSLSPVCSHNSYSPPRKRPRSKRQSKFYKSRSRSPYRFRRRSRSVTPLRRKWKYQRSRSRSVSSRRRSRSRSPKRRRFRSRSPVGIRYLRSRSGSTKSRSTRRGLRKHRRRSSSLSVSPPSPARKRTRLRKQTETGLSSLIYPLNGNRTSVKPVSVTQNYSVPVATTNPLAPSAALPAPQLTQV